MVCMLQLILVLTIEVITFSESAPPTTLTNYETPPLTVLPKNDYELNNYSEPPTPSLSLEVPREDALPTFYFDYPPPSEDLELPSTQPWNPNDDPKYFFELPSSITKQVTATNLYPKKYNKDVHGKQKPLNSKPKQEIALIPISEKDYLMKQKPVNKAALNITRNQAKAENKVLNLKGDNEPQASSSNQGFAPSSNNNRFEFQMHGYDGPLSYKWGYDTGKGYNRQFRYEERDKHGYIKGHYGYSDNDGKLRVIHYDAHPQDGFHAEEKTSSKE